jgi:hypothetical protein
MMTGLKKMVKLVLAFLFALTLLAGSWVTQPALAADPPDNPVCKTCGDRQGDGPTGDGPLSNPVVTSSDDDNVVTFRTDSGGGLDYYTSGSISFDINVHDIDLKTVEKATLTLAVWDVDFNCQGACDGNCERDTVYVNGNPVSSPLSYLTGANDSWSTCTFDVDPAWLQDGDNTILINIDVLSGWCWYVECDWGELAITGNQVDLKVESKDISITPNSWWQFWRSQFQVEAKIHNVGNVDVEDVTIKYLVKAGNVALTEDTKSISKIKSKEFETISFTTNLAPDNTIEIIADPDDTVEESNENNNSAETTQTYGTIVDSAGTKLKHTAVAYQVPDGSNWKDSGVVVFTDINGKYCINNNLVKIEDGKSGRVTAYLKYSPTDEDSKTVLRVIDDSKWGTGWTPADNTPSSKSSDVWNMDKAQNFTKDLTVADNEGGLAYSTLITCYDYHKGRGTAPANETNTEINDTHHLQWGACALADSIFLPIGAQGTTWIDAIAHEYTHVVEQGWNITNQFSTTGHNPNFPVAEGSCHWGSAISRNDSVFTYPADGAYSSWITVDIASDNETSGGPPVPMAFAGARQEFQIAGVMWDLNTGIVWDVLRNGGATAQDVGDTHKKFYTIYKDKDTRDSTVIKGIFQAHADNTTGWPGKDGKDPDNFNGSYTSSKVDTNGDTLAEYLQVNVGVTIDDPGYYYVNGSLTGITSGASTYTNLSAGPHTVSIRFSGEDIYLSKLNGPYHLSVYLVNSSYERVDLRENIYQTSAYAYTEFAHPALMATGVFTDSGQDTNSNGLYDNLLANVQASVTTNGTYNVFASLYAQNNMIAYAETNAVLIAGTRTIQFIFDGKSIRASGKNGPYKVQTSIPNGSEFTTGTYNATSFEAAGVILQSVGSDSGNDINGDGLFDTLVVPVNVNCSLAGNYTLKGSLYNGSHLHITSASSNTDLVSGTSGVSLSFDGMAIRNEGLDGPYDVSITIYDSDQAFLGSLEGTTSSYTSEQFQIAAQDLFELTSFSSKGTDNNSNGLYDYLSVSFNISSPVANGNYRIDGYLDDQQGNLVAFSSTTSQVSTTSRKAYLSFSGQQIWIAKIIDGSYILRVKIFDSNNVLITDTLNLHTTGTYSYNQFEPSATVFNNIFNDKGTDTNSDGLYEYLTVDVGVDATVAGEYKVYGLLSGSEIDRANTTAHLNVGSNVVKLNFDGNAIYRHGENGPYTLKELFLEKSGTVLDYRETAWTTAAYDYTTFGQVVVLTGNYSDEGVDTDSNALFDSLLINFEALAKYTGYYTANGRLMDGEGHEIIWASANSIYLVGGTPKYIPLNFDGIGINRSGANGPYYLKDLYIYNNYNTSQSANVLNAYATKYYNFEDFESILNTSIPGIKLGRADLSVSSISVSSAYLPGVDTNNKPAWVTSTAAYYVDAYGSGNFSLKFVDPVNLNALVVYKVTGSWTTSYVYAWENLATTKTANSMTFSLEVGSYLIILGTVPPPQLALKTPVTGGLHAEISGKVNKGHSKAVLAGITWDWGDGTTDSQALPALHHYSNFGSYTITAVAYQIDGSLDRETFEIDLPVGLAVSNSSLPDGIAKEADWGPVTLAAINGTLPYTWTKSGSWPSWLKINNNVLSGTPTKGGTFIVAVQVTDASKAKDIHKFSLKISPTLSLTVPKTCVGDQYLPFPAWVPTAVGGDGNYTWSSSTLPAGLTINSNTGAFTGTPTVSGNFNVTVTVTDGLLFTSSKIVTMKINSSLYIETSSIPNGEVGLAYKAAFKAKGGTGKYTWSIKSGYLPYGLVFAKGSISGKPTYASSYYYIEVQVSDGIGSVSKYFYITIFDPPVINNPFNSTYIVGNVVNCNLTITGASGVNTWSASGSLPAGLKLNSKAATISGTLSKAGTYKFTLKVKDSLKGTASLPVTIVVNPAPTPTPTP